MSIPIEQYVSAIISKNPFGITGVFQIREIETFKYDINSLQDIKKVVSSGKLKDLEKFEKAKDLLGEDLTLISFFDQENVLFYALIYDSVELSQDPELEFIDKYFFYKLSDSDQDKLLLTFAKLNTLEKKVTFWEKELGVNYAEFLFNNQYYKVLIEFDISADRKEWGNINQWLIESYQDVDFRKPVELYQFKSFKKILNEKLKTTKNKLELIVEELKEIEESFVQTNKHSSLFSMGLKPTFYNKKFHVNYEAYRNHLEYSISPNLSKIEPGKDLIECLNGETLAKYELYLKQLLNKSKTGISLESIEEEKLTIEQIALLLDLSGFLGGCKSDPTDKARVLSELLGIGEKALYDAIRNINSPEIRKNKKHHTRIMDFLEYVDAKGLKYSVKSEIEAILSK